MDIEIPPELLLPTVEELAKKTAHDLETDWKPCKRPGKKERTAIKNEQNNPKQAAATSLSSLFAKNGNAKDSPLKPKPPTLRVSLGSPYSKPVESINHKRGRPPKIKSI